MPSTYPQIRGLLALGGTAAAAPRQSRVMLLLVLGGMTLAGFACGGGGAPEQRSFELTVDPAVTGASDVKEETFRVKQGDQVTLTLRSSDQVSVHLHGYDIVTAVAPGEPAQMTLTASVTGRFAVTAHGAAATAGSDGSQVAAHAGVFESTTLEQGDTFTFVVPHHLSGSRLPYHDHMSHGETAYLVVDPAAPETGVVHVRVLPDGTFDPKEVAVRPGGTVVWINEGEMRRRVTSGLPPAASGEGEAGGEIMVAWLEVHPR